MDPKVTICAGTVTRISTADQPCLDHSRMLTGRKRRAAPIVIQCSSHKAALTDYGPETVKRFSALRSAGRGSPCSEIVWVG